jgi:hypothetical protein
MSAGDIIIIGPKPRPLHGEELTPEEKAAWLRDLAEKVEAGEVNVIFRTR